jgi:hypothetical protein
LLAEELPALRELGFDLGITGFSDEELAELMASVGPEAPAEESSVPPPPAEPVSRAGDLWLLGEHRLLCGDATRLADLQRVLDGRLADYVTLPGRQSRPRQGR